MGTLLSKRAWSKFSEFQMKGIFLAQIVIVSDFLVKIRNQLPKIDPFVKFQPNWPKDKGSRILTSNDSENCLMTSYTRDIMTTSLKFLMILIFDLRFCARELSCQVWW